MSVIGRVAPFLCGGVALDADAAAWVAAVVSNGGTVSAATQTAVSNFCIAAKANSYWTKLNRINLFCGDQLAAALVPLKVGGGNATDTNMNFVSGDYSEATGITGNGSTKYLKTGLLGSSITLNDSHASAYNRSSTAASGGVTLGNGNSVSSTAFRFHMPFSDGKAYVDQYNTVNGRAASGSALSTPYGFMVGSRTASNAHVVYRNGSSVASNSASTSIGSPPSEEIYVFAVNNTGSPSTFISQPLASYSIGLGLSSTDVTNYNTDIQAFQTALGRNV